MAGPGIRISQLTTANPLTGVELFPVVQSGETRQTTVSALSVYVLAGVADTSALSAAITSVNAAVVALEVRVSAVSALVGSLDPSAITSINAVIAAVSARTSVNAAAITSVNVVLANVSAQVSVIVSALTSINNTISTVSANIIGVEAENTATNILVAAVSAQVSVLTARTSLLGGGTIIVSVSGDRFEHEQIVTVTGMTGSRRPLISLGTMVDADENAADMLDILSMGAAPGTGLLTIFLSFDQPTTGAIPINWSTT